MQHQYEKSDQDSTILKSWIKHQLNKKNLVTLEKKKQIIIKIHLVVDEDHIAFTSEWNIAAYTSPYKYATCRRNLFLKMMYFIIREDPLIPVDKRTELISKCCHRNRFTLAKVNKGIMPVAGSY